MNNLINLALSHIASHADWQNCAAKDPNDLLYYAGSGVWKYFLFSVKTVKTQWFTIAYELKIVKPLVTTFKVSMTVLLKLEGRY